MCAPYVQVLTEYDLCSGTVVLPPAETEEAVGNAADTDLLTLAAVDESEVRESGCWLCPFSGILSVGSSWHF